MALFKDNFNRADSALSSPWSTVVGNGAAIVSNLIRAGSGAGYHVSALTALTFANDQTAKATITTTSANDYVGVGVRLDGSGNGYIAMAEIGGSGIEVYRLDTGTPTNLTGFATTFSDGDTFELTITGTTLEVFKNDVSLGTTTDATYASGVTGVAFNISGSNISRLDNYVSDGFTPTVYTSSQTGDFNSAATWGGAGVPTAIDQFSIAASHTVTVPSGYSAAGFGNLLGTDDANRATLVIADGGTLKLHGDLEPDDWCVVQVDGGGTLDLNGNDIAGTSTTNDSVKLTFVGTAPNRALITSSQIGVGGIKHSDNESIRASVTVNYCDFKDCGLVRIGSGADPEDFSVQNTVFVGCDEITLGGLHHGNADFILNGIDIREDRSTTTYIARFLRNDGNQGLAGAGTKLIDKITIRGNTENEVLWDIDGIDRTNIISDRVLHTELDTARDSDMSSWFVRTSSSATTSVFNGVNSQMYGSYIYNDNDSPRTFNSNLDSFASGVIESTYDDAFTTAGEHFVLDPTVRTQQVVDSLILDSQGGALFAAITSAHAGDYFGINNTLVGTFGTNGALLRTLTGGTISGTARFFNNLVYDRSAIASSLGFNLTTAGDDQITEFDNNCWYQIETPYSGVTSATKNVGVDSLYGGNDITADPQFIDSSRDLAAWAGEVNGTATDESAIDHLMKINGYDSVTKTQVDGTSTITGVSELVDWVRYGYTPTNSALRNAGYDGNDIGAIPVRAEFTDTFTLEVPDGYALVTLASGFDTSSSSYLFNYGGTPAIGDQFIYNPSEITLDDQGGWTSNSTVTTTIYAIDASDGYMESFTFEATAPETGITTIDASVALGGTGNFTTYGLGSITERRIIDKNGNSVLLTGTDTTITLPSLLEGSTVLIGDCKLIVKD